MASIYKYGHDPIGRIEGDGRVFDQASEFMGRVVDGQVYDIDNEYVGKITPDGRVYNFSGEQIGSVADDGRILDNEEEELGESESPHMQEGGAAFLLLLR